jgi:hypothetical protein
MEVGGIQMTQIELKYNAFSVKTVLTINGKEAKLRCFGEGTGIRLIEWINDFFPEVIKKSNIGIGAECSVQFYGTQSDFEEVRLAYDEYSVKNNGIKIELPECKRYPQNLDDMKVIITKKCSEYSIDIENKNIELNKLEKDFSDKGNKQELIYASDIIEVEQSIVGCKKMFEDIYNSDLEKLDKEFIDIKTKLQIIVDIDGYKDLPSLLSSFISISDIEYKDDGFDFILKSLSNILNNSLKEVNLLSDKNIYKIIEEYSNNLTALTQNYIGKEYSNMNIEQLKNTLKISIDTSNAPWVHDTKIKTLTTWSLLGKFIEIEKNDSILRGLGLSQLFSGFTFGNELTSIQTFINNAQTYLDNILKEAEQQIKSFSISIKNFYDEELEKIEKVIKDKIEANKMINETVTAYENSRKLIVNDITVIQGKIDTLNDIEVEIVKLEQR